jgi:hypothetical protein
MEKHEVRPVCERHGIERTGRSAHLDEGLARPRFLCGHRLRRIRHKVQHRPLVDRAALRLPVDDLRLLVAVGQPRQADVARKRGVLVSLDVGGRVDPLRVGRDRDDDQTASHASNAGMARRTVLPSFCQHRALHAFVRDAGAGRAVASAIRTRDARLAGSLHSRRPVRRDCALDRGHGDPGIRRPGAWHAGPPRVWLGDLRGRSLRARNARRGICELSSAGALGRVHSRCDILGAALGPVDVRARCGGRGLHRDGAADHADARSSRRSPRLPVAADRSRRPRRADCDAPPACACAFGDRGLRRQSTKAAAHNGDDVRRHRCTAGDRLGKCRIIPNARRAHRTVLQSRYRLSAKRADHRPRGRRDSLLPLFHWGVCGTDHGLGRTASAWLRRRPQPRADERTNAVRGRRTTAPP